MPIQENLLFSPIAIGKLTLPGRLIKTATAETRADNKGFVTQELIDRSLGNGPQRSPTPRRSGRAVGPAKFE